MKDRRISKARRGGWAVLGGLGLCVATPVMATDTVTQYAYDAGNHVTKVTDPRGLVTTYAYDGLGRKWQQTSPDTGTTRWSYDAYGRPSSMTRADNVETTYGYDELNRRTSITAGGQTQTFTYDACTNGLGRLCSAGDTTGTTSYSYSPEGWITGRGFSISGTTYALGYGYNALGQVASVVYPDGNQAIYSYTRGVVSGISFNVGGTSVTGASAITYRPLNTGMTSWTSSNGVVNTLSYDTDGRLTSISAPGVQNLHFSYDDANRVVGITNGVDGSMSQNFGYDEESRLRSVYSEADIESFQYDLDGNRLTQVRNGQSINYTNSATSNRLTDVSGGLSATYGYTPQGNTNAVDGSIVYQYNSFNRLNVANGITNYVNPEGQRLGKAGGQTGLSYFAPAADGGLLAEDDNGLWVDYIWLSGRLIGRISGGQIYAIHTDQVGRPEAVTDADRAVVWRARNFAFDRSIVQNSMGELNLGFPGQYYDNETATWNNGYRDYNAQLGRYLESDPLGLGGGANSYTYVESHPLGSIDPLGLCDEQKCTAARAAIAALGQQLSSEGKTVTWTGIGLVGVSGLAAIVAPEGAPIEAAGAEGGAGLIEVGGTASTLGSALTGYANGGALGAAKELGASYLLGKINSFAAGLGSSSGVSESSVTAVAGLLDQASEGIMEEEAVCNVH